MFYFTELLQKSILLDSPYNYLHDIQKTIKWSKISIFTIQFIHIKNIKIKLLYYLIIKNPNGYQKPRQMHSSFKTKPIPFSQISYFQHNKHNDDDIIPDQHSVKNNKINSRLTVPNNNIIDDKSKCQSRNWGSKNSNCKQNNKIMDGNLNQSNKRLTHGLTSYKDIKQSYNSNHSGSKDKDKAKQLNSINSKNKNKNKHDQQYLNKIDRDYVQCTFTPKTNNNGQSRSFKDFVDLQQSFLTKRQEKIKKIHKQKMEKQCSQITLIPTIDKKSKRISENSVDYNLDSYGSLKKLQKKTSIYQRLYNIHRKKDRLYQQQASFTPKILNKSKTLVRPDKVQNLLYQDAQRRIEHQKLLNSQSYQKQAIACKYPPLGSSTKQGKHNNKLLCKKIRTQFLQLLQTESNDGIIQKNVPAIMVITILSQLFNVELNPNINQQLCSRVISYLINQSNNQKSQSQSQSFAYVQTKKLWQFIKAIVIGMDFYQKGSALFTEEEILKIHSQFGYFYGLRLSKHPTRYEQQNQDQLQYKVETSKNTNRLAQIYRLKKFQQINEFIAQTKIPQSSNSLLNSLNDKNIFQNDHIDQRAIKLQDLFILDQIRKKTILQQKRLKNEENQLNHCTFKPQINQISKKKAERVRSKQNLKTTTEFLQNDHKKQSNQNKKKQKAKKVVIKAKNPEARNSLTDKKLNQQNETCKNIKNVDKTILRLNLARKMKDIQISQRQRGYNCKNSQNWLKQMQDQKKQILGEISNFFGYKNNSQQKHRTMTLPSQNYQTLNLI